MATTNRTVSFVSRLVLDIEGYKVLPHALTFADVDNDGCNELIVGTLGGFLHVFRGNSTTPWCKLTDLGEITAVIVGNVMGGKENHLIVTNTEGTSFLYYFPPEQGTQSDSAKEATSYKPQLVHTQFLQHNVKMMLLGDVDGSGQNDLILCRTDRVVCATRWNTGTERFEMLQEWRLHQIVGAITFHTNLDTGRPQIIASQPGGSYAVLHPNWNVSGKEAHLSENTGPDVTYNPLSRMSRSQNPAMSCQIVGDICKGPDCKKGYFALCTLDGTIKLIEDDEVLWSIQVGHQLFAMNKLDVLANGKEEVIVCAWSGCTYIVDHDRNIVKFQFDESVQAFCAGQYAMDGGENIASLVYVNFSNKVFLYYDVQLPSLTISDFLTEANSNKEIVSLLRELGAETEEEKRLMIRYSMYGVHCGKDSEVMSGEKLELFKRKSIDS